MDEQQHNRSSSVKTVKVFSSYALEDEPLWQKLESHLAHLQKQGRICVWSRRQISPGTESAEASMTHFNEAALILVLVSPDFLVSDECIHELERALERQQRGEALVIPLIRQACRRWSLDWLP